MYLLEETINKLCSRSLSGKFNSSSPQASTLRVTWSLELVTTVEDDRNAPEEICLYDTKTKAIMVFLNMKWLRGYQRMISYHLVHDIFNDRVTRTKSLQH